MQPSFKSVTGKGGIKVIDGSSVKFGRFDGAQPHCVGLTDLVTGDDGSSMAAGFMQWENAFFPWTLNYDEIDMVLEGTARSPRRRNHDRQSRRRDVYPERLQHRIWYDIQREIPVCRPRRLTGNPYERFHHRSMAKSEPYAQRRRRDPSPADSRLTPSARELLESRHLRIKFIDEQGRLFVDDEQQQPQPVHGLTSSDEHPQACCELCRQPVAKSRTL